MPSSACAAPPVINKAVNKAAEAAYQQRVIEISIRFFAAHAVYARIIATFRRARMRGMPRAALGSARKPC
jgi:hypothetical protein